MALNNESFSKQSGFFDQFNSSSSSLGSMDSGQGMATGTSSAVRALTNKLSGLGASVGGALSGALGSVTKGAGVKSELPDLLDVFQSKATSSPEVSRNRVTKIPDRLQFPLDLNRNFMVFIFSDRFQENPVVKRKKRDTAYIYLPIPSNLVEQFGMQYSQKDLGVLGILEQSGALDQSTLAGLANKDTAGETAKGVGKKMTEALASPSGALAVARTVASSIPGGESAGAAIDRATGTILNPYSALQFEGVNLRKHSFTYKLSPNSQAESVVLQKIIQTFKERMHPKRNGLLYEFPDQCKILFASPFSYPIRDCYLESMTVNYAPNGSPAFFKQGTHPVEVEISLQFGEIEPITREFIEENKTSSPSAVNSSSPVNRSMNGSISGGR